MELMVVEVMMENTDPVSLAPLGLHPPQCLAQSGGAPQACIKWNMPLPFGTEWGPTKHVSSEIWPCLLPSVCSLISLLNSLIKKYFPFDIFISTLLKLTWFRKMQFVSVYLSGFSCLYNQHPEQETQHSQTPTSSAPISPSCPFVYSPFIILTSNVKS